MAEVFFPGNPPAWEDTDQGLISLGWAVDDATGEVLAFRLVNNSEDVYRVGIDWPGGPTQGFLSLPFSGNRRLTAPAGITATLENGRWRIPFERLEVERRFATPRHGSPTILGVTTAVFNTDSTTHNHTVPTVDAGDLVLIVFGGNTANAHTAYTSTEPSGFTEVLDNGDGQFDDAGDFRVSIGVFGKNCDGSEDGANANVATSTAIAGSGHIYHIDAGTWSGDVTDIETAVSATIIDGTADSPNLAPSHGSQEYLWLTAGITDNDGPIITAAPTNYTNFTSTEALSTEDSTFATARRFTTASSEDPGAFTQGGGVENCMAVTIAVPPVLAAEEGTVEQEGYRFRNDDGDEDAATWIAAQDVPAKMGLEVLTASGIPLQHSPANTQSHITGNMCIVAHILPAVSNATMCIIARFGSGTNDRIFSFMLRDDAALLFSWSDDGTSGTATDVASTVQWTSGSHTQPVVAGQAFWVAVTHDVDDGAGSRLTKFYSAWTHEELFSNQLGADQTWGNDNPFPAGAAVPYAIAVRPNGGFHWQGKIYGAWVYDGLTEADPIKVDVNFSDASQGWRYSDINRRQQDATGNIWQIHATNAQIIGGHDSTDPFRVRILSNANTNDPPVQTLSLKYKRVDEPESEWRFV